ncbi:YdcF family protein [Lachnospiraceae bacterium 46-15]
MLFYDYLTDFIFIENAPEKADIIFVPGGGYGEIAENAARLYHKGYAPLILVSGKYSITDGYFAGVKSPARYCGDIYETECDFLADILLENQVPPEAILQEKHASYTYENAIYSKKLTDKLGVSVQTAIISCQAYHAKRCLLYFQLLYPETRFLVCPAVTRGVSRATWQDDPVKIDLVLGEVERCGSQFHDILKNRLNGAIL